VLLLCIVLSLLSPVEWRACFIILMCVLLCYWPCYAVAIVVFIDVANFRISGMLVLFLWGCNCFFSNFVFLDNLPPPPLQYNFVKFDYAVCSSRSGFVDSNAEVIAGAMVHLARIACCVSVSCILFFCLPQVEISRYPFSWFLTFQWNLSISDCTLLSYQQNPASSLLWLHSTVWNPRLSSIWWVDWWSNLESKHNWYCYF